MFLSFDKAVGVAQDSAATNRGGSFHCAESSRKGGEINQSTEEPAWRHRQLEASGIRFWRIARNKATEYVSVQPAQGSYAATPVAPTTQVGARHRRPCALSFLLVQLHVRERAERDGNAACQSTLLDPSFALPSESGGTTEATNA